jgi:hypothetical protein
LLSVSDDSVAMANVYSKEVVIESALNLDNEEESASNLENELASILEQPDSDISKVLLNRYVSLEEVL